MMTNAAQFICWKMVIWESQFHCIKRMCECMYIYACMYSYVYVWVCVCVSMCAHKHLECIHSKMSIFFVGRFLHCFVRLFSFFLLFFFDFRSCSKWFMKNLFFFVYVCVYVFDSLFWFWCIFNFPYYGMHRFV